MYSKYLYAYKYNELENILSDKINENFRVKQIIDGLYKSKAIDFKNITTLSKEIKNILINNFIFFSLSLIKKEKSNIDNTTKFLFKLEDEKLIEAVAIPNIKKQYTLCISTQVGCPLKCAFCASGFFGLERNLKTNEIIEQIMYIKKQNFEISNIVFMGIGEPLLNYNNVINAIEIINNEKQINIGARKITISTAGIINGIKKLSDYKKQIRLSVSLHFPDNDMRNKYMPVNLKNPLPDLIDILKEYQRKTNKIITFEYILFKDINDNLQIADNMRKLLKRLNYKINLIPYNKIEGFNFKSPNRNKIYKFYNHLKKKKVNVTLRQKHGTDINAACGQLRLKEINLELFNQRIIR